MVVPEKHGSLNCNCGLFLYLMGWDSVKFLWDEEERKDPRLPQMLSFTLREEGLTRYPAAWWSLWAPTLSSLCSWGFTSSYCVATLFAFMLDASKKKIS